MKCPNTHTCAGVDLVMTERQGVEIDYCPQCRGVWLDRGELDKLMDRAAAQAPAQVAPPAQPPAYAAQQHHRRPDFEDSDFQPHRGHPGAYKRKKSWLSDIFD
ncbi:MAG: zf-TFIIB domain-containing protein [Burkholderiaceae bacterium]